MPFLTSADIAAVQSISAVPTILRVVAETTDMRFVCIARATPIRGRLAPCTTSLASA